MYPVLRVHQRLLAKGGRPINDRVDIVKMNDVPGMITD